MVVEDLEYHIALSHALEIIDLAVFVRVCRSAPQWRLWVVGFRSMVIAE